MLTIADALTKVLEQAGPLPARREPLPEALECTLAEDVAADIDLPPFDKALVDGYAVRLADLGGGPPYRLKVGEEILAGRVPTRPLGRREAAAIMTGAPLPEGADAVVMVEQTRRGEHGDLLIEGPVAAGQNRLARGREVRSGEVVLRAGERLNPARLGLLGSVGREEVRVIPRPRVAIVPTGDELVGCGQAPGPGQIRESNSGMLAALVRGAGATAIPRGIAPDDPEGLRQALQGAWHGDGPARSADVLLVCGGVSAGKKDLVPEALTSIGVMPVFHKVALRPGKPLWFGVGPEREGPGTLVFGLPGNPVSGLVCFQLFVGPALDALRGRPSGGPVVVRGRLAAPFDHKGERATYHPARVRTGADGFAEIEPLDWAGSADLRAVAVADGFAHFAPGDRRYEAGEVVDFLPL